MRLLQCSKGVFVWRWNRVDGKLSRENRGENGFVCCLVGRGERNFCVGPSIFHSGPHKTFLSKMERKEGRKVWGIWWYKITLTFYCSNLPLSISFSSLVIWSSLSFSLFTATVNSASALSSFYSTFYCINLLCKFVAHIVAAQLGR